MAEPPYTRPRRPSLKKRFGQHHLRSAGVCRPSLEFLDLGGADVLEIGGGGGVLTRLLCERARRVICWEIDPEWAFLLRERLGAEASAAASVEASEELGAETVAGLRVVVGDALEIDWRRLPSELRLAGNLPYNVGTRIILGSLRHSRVERAAFLVQREVADRLLANPGDAAYGSLSVAVASQAIVRRLGRVGRRDFSPAPKVDGAFVGLERREPPVPEEELDAYLATVRSAFGARRKTLRNALRGVRGADEIDGALADLGWSSKIRAEALAVADFVRLHRALAARAG